MSVLTLSAESNIVLTLGPPGCGKTTALADSARKAIARYQDNRALVVVSLTNTAAHEIASRQLPVVKEQVGTLHAICYRQLDRPQLVGKHLAEWNHDYPYWKMETAVRVASPEEDGEVTTQNIAGGRGDELVQEYDLLRHRMVARSAWPAHVVDFATRWEDWKQSNGLIDFTDMIERCYRDFDGAPFGARLLMADECFPYDALVTLADGSRRKIGDIVENKEPHRVVSYNIASDTLQSRQITNWRKVPRRGRPILQWKGLRATEDHPVYTREHGYVFFKDLLILAMSQDIHVLELTHEDIQHYGSTDSGRAVYPRRLATWRCVTFPIERNQRQCACPVCTRTRAAIISSVEKGDTVSLGAFPYSRTAVHLFQRIGLFLYDTITSRFYRAGASQRTPQRDANDSRHAQSARSACSSGVVYGRWVSQWSKGSTPYTSISTLCSVLSRRVVRTARNSVSAFTRWKRLARHYIFSARHQEAFYNDPSVSAAGICIQAGPIGEATERGFSCAGFAHGSHNALCRVWDWIYPQKIPANMQQRVQRDQCADVDTAPSSDLCSPDGRDSGTMCDMWRDLSEEQAGIFFPAPTDLLSSVSRTSYCTAQTGKESSEEWVYCLNVADNHNFFADDILVSNCQDLSRLEFAQIRKWATYCDFAMIAGDEDQCIYSWRGADPENLIALSPRETRILSQSYRLPPAVHAYCQGWVQQISRRIEKDYFPRADSGPGEVAHWAGDWRNPTSLLQLCEEAEQAHKSLMILTACGYQLGPLITRLKQEGVPFANAYRPKKPAWNPLQRRTKTLATVDRVLAFLGPQEDPTGRLTWTWGELQAWVPLVQGAGVLQRNAKMRVKTEESPIAGEPLPVDFLLSLFDPDAVNPLLSGDLGWLWAHTLGSHKERVRYFCTLYEKRGAKGLAVPEGRPAPGVPTLGSIHSVKGGEADWVYVFPDLSQSGYAEWTGQSHRRDTVLRQFYVAASRAREKLFLGGAGKSMAVQW